MSDTPGRHQHTREGLRRSIGREVVRIGVEAALSAQVQGHHAFIHLSTAFIPRIKE